jgi:hypothetical protein
MKVTLRLATKNTVAAVNAIRKWNAKPSAAVAVPPLNEAGPSQPAAIACRRREGFTPLGHQVMKAAVISKHPHRKPAKKMARNGRDVCVPETARFEDLKLAFLSQLRCGAGWVCCTRECDGKMLCISFKSPAPDGGLATLDSVSVELTAGKILPSGAAQKSGAKTKSPRKTWK